MEENYWKSHCIEEEIIIKGIELQKKGWRINCIVLSPSDYSRLLKSLGCKFNGKIHISTRSLGVHDEVGISFSNLIKNYDPITSDFSWEIEKRLLPGEIPPRDSMEVTLATIVTKLNFLEIKIDKLLEKKS